MRVRRECKGERKGRVGTEGERKGRVRTEGEGEEGV